MSEAITLERLVKAGEFRERWLALGFKTRAAIGNEIGVSEDAVKLWDKAKRPIPRYAWRSLERAESA